MLMPALPVKTKGRKELSVDALIALLRDRFEKVADHRQPGSPIPVRDALMSAFAMFSLKEPSLLAFDERRNDANLKTVYRIGQIPSDTQMREILDDVEPEELADAFSDVFRQVQRGKELEPFVFFEGQYLVSLDGTGYFSSQNVHCDSCLVVEHKNGTVSYQHKILPAVIVHPDHREVIPLAAEPIVKQDGTTKNDCERNAARRLLRKIRQQHPHLKLIVVEDSLASNGPHIRDLKDCHMHFILGVKPGDHEYMFKEVERARQEGRAPTMRRKEGKHTCEVSWVWSVPLNNANDDLKVDFLEYKEFDEKGKCVKHFTWVTDLLVNVRTAWLLARGGRAHWKVENETFNTLKNQGYHFEHNFGHGVHNLSVVFATLMMLAFLVDQVQQLTCPLFRAVYAKLGSKRALWDNLRSHFRHFLFSSMQQIYEVILYDRCKEVPLPAIDSS